MADLEEGRGRKWLQQASKEEVLDPSPQAAPAHSQSPSSHNKDDKIEILEWTPNDARNPYNWSSSRKWITAALTLFGTFVLTLNGTGITIAADEISEEFHIIDTSTFSNTYWMVFSWNMGGAFFVLFLPLLEDFGVKRPYMLFYTLFFCMVIPQALAQNYATLIVTRIISGGCTAVLANTIASAIPDLWESDSARSVPVGLYILLYVVGNTAGPVVFSPVMQYIGNWRWIFYIQLIVYGALAPVYLFFLPETRGHTILGNEAKRIRKESGRPVYTVQQRDALPIKERLLKSVARPLYLLFTEPVLLASTVWSAFALGLVFAFTQSTEQVFQELYGWTAYQCGYVQAAVVIGELLGWPITLYGTNLYLKSARRNREDPGRPIPEARLYVSVFGSFVGITSGMFVYAWTSYPFLPWYAPAIGLAMVGFGIQIVVCVIADYVVDLYAASDFAGSAIAAVVVGEQIVAAALPLAEASMYTNLGFQWASSLLGFIALLLSLIPLVFIWQGRNLRERSPFMKSNGMKSDDKVTVEKL
ncbi:Putative major facilitator superfamily, MFS transporter superfamily [Septoria linicola]|uniref:Major facilitator superfamily, MFS transporter superfamily n=1 Tax=Septoria linicola TaxID=215465 RepID=A0A9Q9APD0_9PEZI|nr:putative major facilitator superfamily, MFS transporter superfamily [Septoria linicola]USW49647.1 Putative major facilitator superfamily, MFS transporter superfamily [Septoria linicola]